MSIFLMGCLSVVVLIVLFGITIFVHEFGHFLAALACGMKVDVFSLGFGKALWRRTYRGIVFKISSVPFGGYVALPQLDPTGMSMIQGQTGKDGKVENLPPVAPWKRMIVLVSGPLGNLVLAVIFAWIVYFDPNALTEEGNKIVGFVQTNSVAYARGLRPGDEIMAVNGEKVDTWRDFQILCHLGSKQKDVALRVKSGTETREISLPLEKADTGFYALEGISKAALCVMVKVDKGSEAERAGMLSEDVIRKVDGIDVLSGEHFVSLIRERPGKTIRINIERMKMPLEVTVTPRIDPATKLVRIGVQPGELRIMPWMQYKKPWRQIADDSKQIFRMLQALTTPKESGAAADGMGGPPMILVSLWFSIQLGLINAISFARFLNVNLAILNMLPIPVLDGGHLLFVLWAMIRRKEAPAKLVNALVNVFAALVIGLMVFLTFRDFFVIPRLFGSDSKTGKARKETAAKMVEKEGRSVETPAPVVAPEEAKEERPEDR